MAEARWAPDPYGRFEFRYFDGARWTDDVSERGENRIDRVPAGTPLKANLPVVTPTAAAAASDRSSNADVLTKLKQTKYLGSHPRVSGQVEGVDVVFTRGGIVLRRAGKDLGSIPWSSVLELAADDRDAIERRTTATRLLVFGFIALLAKKETTVSYLVIREHDGSWIFAVPGIRAIELRSGLSGLQKYVTVNPTPPVNAPASQTAVAAEPVMSSPTDRLNRLNELHESGLINAQEYNDRRAAIIAEL